jgi:predicted 2-oxoglutarate/Fe(II)-dependent dioxygenase YbiX
MGYNSIMFEIAQKIDNYGLYLSNCISQEDIDELLEISKSDLLEKGSSRLGSHVVIDDGIGWRDFYKGYSMADQRKSSEISNKVFQKLYPVMVKSMEVYTSHFGLDINDYTMTKPIFWIKTYDVGANIGNHSDSWESHDGKTLVPAVSIVLYLSSDFEGGELVFIDKDSVFFVNKDTGVTVDKNEKDIIIKPSAGHVAIFDSNKIHKVKQVISGARISTDITYMK